jgi:hypothetical protein
MDVVWGETAGVDGQLWLLYPILFILQVFMLPLTCCSSIQMGPALCICPPIISVTHQEFFASANFAYTLYGKWSNVLIW